MQKYRIQCTIDVETFAELDAAIEFHELIRDNDYLGFSNGNVLTIEELEEENE